MFELAGNFEQTARQLSPVVLIVPGLICVIAGLFIWLGGVGFGRVLTAVVGAAAGAGCGFFIGGQEIMPTMVAAGIGAVAAIIFERMFITIMSGGLAAVLGFAVLAQLHDIDFSGGFRKACLTMPVYSWVVIAVLLIVFITAALFWGRLTRALCCATLGTILVFTGMILLLLYKGAAPVSIIGRRIPFYGAAFIIITAFGTLEQLVLCPRLERRIKTKKQTGNETEENDKSPQNWRTA